MSLLAPMMIKRKHGSSPESPWTEGTPQPRRGYSALGADATYFVSTNADYYIQTASNPSGIWTQNSNAVGGSYSIKFIKKCGSYWILGKNTTNKTFYCSDPTGSWTQTSLPTTTPVNYAIYSSTASLYIIVGESGFLYTASTISGTWTSRTSNFGTSDIECIYDNSSLIVIVGTDGKMATSTDGITWTTRTSSFGTHTIYSTIYGNSIWVFAGEDSIATSSDPTSSVTQNTSTGITAGSLFYDVTCVGNEFVISGNYSSTQKAYQSTTPASSWTTKNLDVASSSRSRTASNSSYFCITNMTQYTGAFGRPV